MFSRKAKHANAGAHGRHCNKSLLPRGATPQIRGIYLVASPDTICEKSVLFSEHFVKLNHLRNSVGMPSKHA